MGETFVKPNRQKIIYSGMIVTLLLLMSLGGCLGSKINIVPGNGAEVMTLRPDEVVTIMKRAGYSDNQIYDHGFEVHEALARVGEAIIEVNGKKETRFLIQGDQVYVQTLKGWYLYNVNTSSWVNPTIR